MNRALLSSILYLATLILLASCASNRNLVYFNNLNSTSDNEQGITNRLNPVIQPGDLLSITVNSASPESNVLLNTGILLPTGNPLPANEQTRKASEGYLVDDKGNIKFPVLGQVALGGLTREAAINKLTSELAKNTVKSPTVNISYLNFRITVLGEVTKPSTFVVPNEHITLLEALGMAGDMTAFGQREKVLVIREKDGKRTIGHLDLTNKEVFASPYFYLQQNDVVYVAPDRARSLQASSRTINLPIYLSVASVVAIIVSSLLLRR
jgi:polysaccharide export outer membrane protein